MSMPPIFERLAQLRADLAAAQAELDDLEAVVFGHAAVAASLTKAGHVQLSSAVNSTSETLAATPKAVSTHAASVATAARTGHIRIATDTEAEAGTLTTVAINPKQLMDHSPDPATLTTLGIVKPDGSTVTIANGVITSVARYL